MTVKTLPRSSLEVIKAKLFFHLLVSLLAYPSRLDGGRQGAQVGRGRSVDEIIFFLSQHPLLADEQILIPLQMLSTLARNPPRWPVGDPYANGTKASLEFAFRAGA